MPAPEKYSVTERLRDGREVEIRALRPDDKDDMLAAVGRTGTQSLQRRFFVVKRGFSEKEIAFFMDIDFANHVALVALAEEDGRSVTIGGGRYVVTAPGKAEIAFVVIDDYQGQGIGTLLMRHLAVIARKAGLKELIAICTGLNYRQIIAVIGDSANAGSIKLHASLGFVRCGLLRSTGFKFGRWVDSVYMQLPLGQGDRTKP